jgi:hypothetical protein
VEEDFEIAQRARRMDAARLEEERERASVQAAQERVAAAEAHAARVVAEAEASAAAIRRVRDELTARLTEARRVLTALPDLADRPQQRPGVPQQVQHPQAPSQPGQQQRPGATEEVRVQRREPEGPQTAVQPVAGPPTAVQPAVGPQTAVQRAVGPQTGGQPAGTRPSPHPRGPETPARGAGEAAAAQQPTRSPAPSPQPPAPQSPSTQAPSTQPAAPQPETPSSEQTQQIRPVHASGQDEGRHSGGSTRVTEQTRPAEDAPAPQGPPTLVQPAASPRDTGSQPAVPGRR